MQAERALQLDAVQGFLAGRFSLGAIAGGTMIFPAPLRVAVRPVLELDGIFMLQSMSELVHAATMRNWPAASAIMDRLDQDRQFVRNGVSLKDTMHIMSRLLLPSLSRAILQHYRRIASRRMAAISLAIRLFELDRGRRPVELAELVPKYLDVLPDDLFAGDGRTFGYKPNAERPVLYSISDDGRDDGGQYELKAGGWVDLNQKDLVYFLNGDRPLDPPIAPTGSMPLSGQAVEDYSEKQVGQGDADQGEKPGEKP